MEISIVVGSARWSAQTDANACSHIACRGSDERRRGDVEGVGAIDGKSDTDTFEFESPRALFTVLTPKRRDLIERLQALGEVSLRGLARTLGRDVKRVHEDAAVLLDWGLIERTASGKLHVPYEKIHAAFDLLAAA